MPDMSVATSHYVANDGAHIAYRLDRAPRAARTLVMIHGLASTMSRWSEFVRQTALRDSCNLLRIDLRGQGGSVFRGASGMREWCADIAGVLRREGIPQAILVGHCLGANIALRFAGAHSDMTSGLVLVEPMPRDALSGDLRAARFIRPSVLGAAWVVRLLVLSASGSSFTDPVLSRELLLQLPEADFRQLPALHWISTEAPEEMRAAIEDWIARRFPCPRLFRLHPRSLDHLRPLGDLVVHEARELFRCTSHGLDAGLLEAVADLGQVHRFCGLR